MRVEVANLHRRLQTTMVYVTHDQVEAMTLGTKIVVLQEGSVRQIGTPNEVYDSPANLFVAAFIGIPTINLMEGSLSDQEEKVVFVAGDLRLPIEPSASLTDYMGKPVTAGIRPEFLHPGEGPLKGSLEHRERIGPEVVIYVRVGNFRLAAKVSVDFPNEIGDEVALQVDGRNILFFHEGILIERRADETGKEEDDAGRQDNETE
jgi:multiple sugar transport system ATP-binding protein